MASKETIHTSSLTLAAEVVAANRTERRKLKKIMKKEQKKQDLPGYEMSIYERPKKLLILDLNKVLLYRKKGTMKFIPRPYVVEFLQDMAQRFQLAIWTSMKQRSAGDLLSFIFQRNNIPLLFTWFQNRCTIQKRQHHQIDANNNRAVESNKRMRASHTNPEEIDLTCDDPLDSFGSCAGQITDTFTQHNESSNLDIIHHKNNVGSFLPQSVHSSTSLSWSEYATLSHSSSLVDDVSKDDSKPIFYKELKRVWSEYRLFNATNTILLDDTEEKCLFNQKYNCIHPKAFELAITDLEFHSIVTHQPDCAKPTLLTEDEELKPQGTLWQYLDRIAACETSVQELYEQLGPYVCSSNK